MTKDIILKAEDIKKTYLAGEKKINALRGIDFQFESDTFYVIIGKSGSGKSTLLHVLSGMDKPSEGQVFFREKDLGELNNKQLSEIKRKEFGFIFQSYNLLPELSAYENIILPSSIDKRDVDYDYLRMITKSLDINNFIKKYPGQLSGGEQQRVAIARALINQPDIVFADEPTGNLDEENGNEVIKLLIRMKKQLNKTIILVTHDMDIAKRADVLIKLKDGMITDVKKREKLCIKN
ncbi:putative ABC transport system ATP-binding protein [Lachnospiraceae bacterium PF1-21]|uniref:ABC transporter ATP-binding protein n=1 Tax=Ohessyouella blattaphilus TaxID=2949333 RepID=A0ABT1ELD4_9FIRM|nr:ABC transporter ATP-binding protein [Ohessyouella blattaphilus]MCP1111509.1 ABC transporter ATP-binding protein [Ohessyouella blattaphilus]MCR8564903.1 ABC transporter ATP-binding protein [Ohessyouella blattaphilus]